ncbi:MAG: penicillin-binding protein activator [Rhodospirillales bacterium]
MTALLPKASSLAEPPVPSGRSTSPLRLWAAIGLMAWGLAACDQSRQVPPHMQVDPQGSGAASVQGNGPAAGQTLSQMPMPSQAMADPAFRAGPAPAGVYGPGYQPYWWGTPGLQTYQAQQPPVEQGAVLSIPLPSMPAKGAGIVRIALLAPLTGQAGEVGLALQRAAQLALFDFGGPTIEMLVQDTLGTPEGAYEAAGRAIADGADILIGPLLASSAQAIKPLIQAADLKALAFTNDRTVTGDGVYAMGFAPGDQVDRVVAYAVQRGLVRFAVLAPEDPYGITVMAAAQDAIARHGGKLARTRYFDAYADDHSEVVKDLADFNARHRELLRQKALLAGKTDSISKQALKRLDGLQTYGDLDYDALLVADGGKRLIAVAALLPFYDIDPKQVKILGTGQWDVAGLGAEPALLGAWYAAPGPDFRTDFVRQYQATFGMAPHRLATLAYDAAALAAVLAQAPNGPDFSAAVIEAPSGYQGRDGVFRFGPDGTAERGLAVLEIGRRSNQVIDQAPTSLPPRAIEQPVANIPIN